MNLIYCQFNCILLIFCRQRAVSVPPALLMHVNVVVLISSNHLVLWCFLSWESNINLYWIHGWWVAAHYEIAFILTGMSPACVDGPIFCWCGAPTKLYGIFCQRQPWTTLATPFMTTDEQCRQTFYCENCTSVAWLIEQTWFTLRVGSQLGTVLHLSDKPAELLQLLL